MIAKKTFFNGRMLRVRTVNANDIASNTGRMINYLAHDRHLGPVLIHCGTLNSDHMATIDDLFRREYGNSGDMTHVEMII